MEHSRIEIYSADAVAIQRSFINRVYGWMTAGLAITGLTALYVAGRWGAFAIQNRGLFYILLLAEVLLVVGLSSAIKSISPLAATCGFLVFAALNGVTLSWIFLAFSKDSITTTFLSTSLTFGAMGVYGWVTKRDLTSFGNLAFMLLIGLIISSLINLFWGNSTFDLIISAVGILVFVGLTAYDTQKIKALSLAIADGEVSDSDGKKLAIFGALELYLDFINLFLYLLRFLGNRK